ncbi:hypothetical protein M885DRAFT_558269 [Pelagophyceae sp. CCMP2097]|nr:hypothetical protein M885DRAFT_558269 [Pelagophyceae sp. CCMP2097]
MDARATWIFFPTAPRPGERPTEAARRRAPKRAIESSPEVARCKYLEKGACKRGSKCRFIHDAQVERSPTSVARVLDDDAAVLLDHDRAAAATTATANAADADTDSILGLFAAAAIDDLFELGGAHDQID